MARVKNETLISPLPPKSAAAPRPAAAPSSNRKHIKFGPAFKFLFKPARYKVLHSGRGAGKSWAVARALLAQGAMKPLRVLCARETQRSIGDSVHRLLADQVKALGLEAHYTIQQASIFGANGTEFLFAGLRQDVSKLKSYESMDICWVEEAQAVSRHSWEVLIPTIRKEGSEIWVTFNPELETDETYRRFVTSPPPGAEVRRISWRDNEWFPDVLRAEMEYCRKTDPEGYHTIWEGHCRQAVEGAIYAAEIAAAEREERIAQVPYDSSKPVHTYWDIGDRWTAIWFIQTFPFEVRAIDYIEEEGLSLSRYAALLQEKGYTYGAHHLPHDARAPQLSTGQSIEEQLRGYGYTVTIVPRLPIADGINAVREMFPRLWFDAGKCVDGLQALRHYRWGPLGPLGTERREPLHDWASHGSDALRYVAVGRRAQDSMSRPATHAARPYIPMGGFTADSWMG